MITINKRSSFTLIELIITITILFIVLAITIPKMPFFNLIILNKETELMASTFSHLQQKAITSNITLELIFTTTANKYTYQTTSQKTYTHILPKPIQFGFRDKTLGPPSNHKNPILKSITFKRKNIKGPTVSFFPDGNISAGTVYLIDKNKKYMKALTCSVEETSYLRIYDYINNKWKN